MRLNSRLFAMIAALGATCFASAFATTNQQVSVTGDVVGDCTNTVPSTGTINFGSYNPFSTSDLSGGPFQFSINCTRGDTNLAVTVNGGLYYANANPSGDRAMKDTTGHYLTYQLYETAPPGATAWPFTVSNGVGTGVPLTAGGINSANPIALYGLIPHGQSSGPDAGTYGDTVTVTVSY